MTTSFQLPQDAEFYVWMTESSDVGRVSLRRYATDIQYVETRGRLHLVGGARLRGRDEYQYINIDCFTLASFPIAGMTTCSVPFVLDYHLRS